jgi:hypothetical protein
LTDIARIWTLGFRGRVQAIVCDGSESGKITVKIIVAGLESKEVEMNGKYNFKQEIFQV